MFVRDSAAQQAGTYSLKRLFVFRSAVIASELTVILLAVYVMHVALPMLNMLVVVALYVGFNLYVWQRLQNHQSASANEFFFHLVLDVVALAALLYFAGGSSNPFVSLFLLPLVIAAATLPRRYVWGMAAVTLCFYTLLMVINVPLTPDMASHHQHAPDASDFSLHVLGMWFSFLLGAGLILFFVVSMAEALRQRDLKLAEAREKHLRDEHMVSLGTLAAGAAHELGTPLATMAVLTREMEQENRDNPELLENIKILRSQVDRCKTTLGQISASAGQMKAESGRQMDVESCIHHCIGRWQELHPDTAIAVSAQGEQPAPVIVVDETVNQAVINVLNNAADASPQRIAVDACWGADELQLEVRDYGEGLSPAALEALGKPFFTTKKDGHGLGFYLASEVVRRIGGEVHIANHEDGGAVVSITLPLQKLKTE